MDKSSMRTTQGLLWALTAIAIAGGSAVQAAPARTDVNIVLVHGALIDGSSWRGVYDVLTRDGYRVSIVQEPLTGFEEDVAATRQVLDRQDGPVVLVGNSYGGQIITVAGEDPKVKALVYVAALQPDIGEVSADVYPPGPSAKEHLMATTDGFVIVDPTTFAADVGADLPKAQAEFMAHSQTPVFGGVFKAKLTTAAWHDKPSYAIIATQDKELDPELAQRMAKRAGSHMTLIKASHFVHVSQPRAVAQVIETAARAIR